MSLVLSDPEKRALYDERGEEAFQSGPRPGMFSITLILVNSFF